MKKKTITYVSILAVAIALIITVYLLAASNFNLVDYLIKLHGG